MKSKRVIILISGNGSNMEALAKAAAFPDYPVEIVAVISDRDNILGIEKAKILGLMTHVVARKDYSCKASHENALLTLLNFYKPDIICLAGYMRLISTRIIRHYNGRILNIHPSLLPLFPGLNTYERALKTGMKISGCTVHLVTEEIDAGRILAQGAVPILADDTVDTLARRILKIEHQIYPLALKAFIKNEKLNYLNDASLISF